MKIRFKNARILTMSEGEPIFSGELHVEGNRISYVGEGRKEFDEIEWDREVECKGNLIMPGFKNAHTHSAMTFLRSFAEDVPLLEWLHEKVFPMEAKLEGDDIYHLSKLAIMEYLTSGITANFDMYFSPDQVAKASVDCGFRTVMCGSINDFVGDIDFLEHAYITYNQYHDLISYQLGCHAEYTTSKDRILGIAALSQKYKAPVYLHLSETKEEVQQCVERYGMTPTVFLEQSGLFEYGGGGYHCVHMSEEDLVVFKEKNLFVISNPGSNCKLASGVAPLTKMLEMGIPVALGTDGPASNNCLDMFREMFLATALQKITLQDATALSANEVLKMATVQGANAMCLPDCDVLQIGKLADLIVIDLMQPNMQPMNDVVKNIVFSGSKQNVSLTMVNGKILYENGQFYIGSKPEEIYQKANEIIQKIRSLM